MLSEKSCEQLFSFMRRQGITNLVPQDKLHVTISYSNKSADVQKKECIVKAGFVKYELFDKDSLVLILSDCDDLINRHKEFIKAGANYDYASYVPHITIAKGVSEVPSDISVPDFKIELDREVIEDIIV